MINNLKIVIVYSPDPIYMDAFIYKIIEQYSHYIVAVIETQGSISKKKTLSSQIDYYLALLLILGFKQTFINTYKMLFKKEVLKDKIKKLCQSNHLSYTNVKSVNSVECIELLNLIKPNIVFNQSQHIIKKNVLETASIGFINRHGALLPKYRGRLAPFWQLYNKEKFGGLTYHFIDEKIDNGKIIKQYPIEIKKNDNVNSLINKMFNLAIEKFGEVIDCLSRSNYEDNLLENNQNEATYFTSPTLKDALRYRFGK